MKNCGIMDIAIVLHFSTSNTVFTLICGLVSLMYRKLMNMSFSIPSSNYRTLVGLFEIQFHFNYI